MGYSMETKRRFRHGEKIHYRDQGQGISFISFGLKSKHKHNSEAKAISVPTSRAKVTMPKLNLPPITED